MTRAALSILRAASAAAGLIAAACATTPETPTAAGLEAEMLAAFQELFERHGQHEDEVRYARPIWLMERLGPANARPAVAAVLDPLVVKGVGDINEYDGPELALDAAKVLAEAGEFARAEMFADVALSHFDEPIDPYEAEMIAGTVELFLQFAPERAAPTFELVTGFNFEPAGKSFPSALDPSAPDLSAVVPIQFIGEGCARARDFECAEHHYDIFSPSDRSEFETSDWIAYTRAADRGAVRSTSALQIVEAKGKEPIGSDAAWFLLAVLEEIVADDALEEAAIFSDQIRERFSRMGSDPRKRLLAYIAETLATGGACDLAQNHYDYARIAHQKPWPPISNYLTGHVALPDGILASAASYCWPQSSDWPLLEDHESMKEIAQSGLWKQDSEWATFNARDPAIAYRVFSFDEVALFAKERFEDEEAHEKHAPPRILRAWGESALHHGDVRSARRALAEAYSYLPDFYPEGRYLALADMLALAHAIEAREIAPHLPPPP